MSKRFLMNCAGIIAVLLIIYLLFKVSFVFNPIIGIFNLLLVPFVLAGFFYYLLRPIVHYLDKLNWNRTLSVIFIYVFIAILFAILIISIWPTLQKQIEDFMKNIPQLVQGLGEQITLMEQNRYFAMLNYGETDLSKKLSDYANRGFSLMTDYANGVFAFISNFIIIIGTFPIILFFLLKDSEKTPETMLRVIPKSYRRGARETMAEIDAALSGYISARMINTLLLGIMTYISFMIIGVPYALLLAIVLAIISFIPFFGTFLGAIPPLIVAFIQSPQMAVWVMVAVLITQQVQDNVLSPFIFGKTLDIHPFSTIIILLIAGHFAGILGMILALPVYMILKITIQHIYQLFFAENVEEMMEK